MFTAKERRIMDLLYATPGMTVSDVRTQLADNSSYSSVRASLNRLVDKDHLETERSGAKLLYSPSQDTNDVSRGALKHLMSTFFKGSPAATIGAVLQFSDEEIDPHELEEIKKMIQAAEQNDG